MYKKGLIEVHPESALDAFNFDDEDNVLSYVYSVMYYPLIGPDVNARRQWVSEVEQIFQSRNWPDQWHQQWLPLWKYIALHECLEYFGIVLNEHTLPFNPGEKTHLIIEHALNDFSTGQVFYIIWQAAKAGAAFYMRRGSTPQHAANYAISDAQRRIERARTEKWDIPTFRRRYDRPISMMARTLFETAMQIGHAGFSERPGAIGPFDSTSDSEASTPQSE